MAAEQAAGGTTGANGVRTAGYGTWESPITAAATAAHDGRPNHARYVGDEVWWTEPRPAEGGRVTLVRRRADGTVGQALDAPWNVRSRVHEYGGLSWAGGTGADGRPFAVFAHFADQRLYRLDPDGGAPPAPLTPAPDRPAGLRYIEPVLVPERGEVWCVREAFHGDGPSDLSRAVVAVPLDGSAADDPSRVRTVLTDRHFLGCARPSPDGRRIAWLAWDHPNMPWDGTELRVADLGEDGTAGPARTLAGGPEVSVAQLAWEDAGTLLAAIDGSGWWNLHRVAADGSAEPVNVLPRAEEFAGPLWQLGARWFTPLDSGLVAAVHGVGAQRLAVVDPVAGELRDCPAAELTEWAGQLDARGTAVVGIAGGADRDMAVVELDTATGKIRTLSGAAARGEAPDGASGGTAAYLPAGEERTFTGPDGRTVHANLYPPRNPDFTAPDGELPPYAIWIHGGPTSRSGLTRDLEIAYFTSRGIGVVDVNYGGSTGFGRAYRNRLRQQWGVVDVADAALVARALADEGLADRGRLAIRGGSAGGFTSAAALTTDLPEAVGVFGCAAIYYPVLDLVGFGSGETHDFESRYLDSMIGRLPEDTARYEERSPARHADRLTVPFVLLQGLEDQVCPPSQAQKLLRAIEGRGIPHRYLAFEGEQHGFRKAETVIACLEAEVSLYGQVFGFAPVGVPVLELEK